MNILFINACVRGSNSRTLKLARELLKCISKTASHKNIHIQELDLMKTAPQYMTYDNFDERQKLIAAKDFSHEMFDLAKEFSNADRIIIAAPFWEYSFPAILKVYIENVSIAGLTFKYTQQGSRGLCKADKLLYITTRGGDFSSEDSSCLEMGARYIETMCLMFGIEDFQCVAVDGLDDERNDVSLLMDNAINTQIPAAADKFIR